MNELRLLRCQAHPLRLSRPIIEGSLTGVKVGEICEIRPHWLDKNTGAKAQVLGFNRDIALLSLIGNARGLSREAVLSPTGAGLSVTHNQLGIKAYSSWMLSIYLYYKVASNHHKSHFFLKSCF